MKMIPLLLSCFLLCTSVLHAQKKPDKTPSPAELEKTMKELKKQMESMDPETRKAMEEMGMFDMLKQVEKTTQEAGKKGVDINAMAAADPQKIPAKPSSLPIPSTPAGKEQLKAYLQPLMQSTNAAIKPNHKAEIGKHLNKGKETGEIAMGYLINREMDKALYLLLNACLTDTEDYVSLNNLGAFMTMSGYAHKSLPILQYVQKQFPQTPPTLLNNIGQAWLSLGYMDKANKFLKDALKADSTQTQASFSLAVMAKHQGNTAKCIDYIKKTIENGGSTPDAISILANEDPGADMLESIRGGYKLYYNKSHAITKRFRAPAVPGTYGAAIASYNEVETFFQDLHQTSNEAAIIAAKMGEELELQKMKIFQDQNRDLANLMKNPGDPGALLRHHLKYNHPLKAVATLMMASMYNSSYSTSFDTRLRREEENRLKKDKALLKSLEEIEKNRSAILREASKIEGGENGDDEVRLEQLYSRACALEQDYQNQLLSGRAAIANQYVHNMEDLLNQKLQEEIFWLLIVGYPADPTASVYQAYASYLKGINGLKKVYPDAPLLAPPCREDALKFSSIKGKLQQWEADHCNVSWGFDVKVFKGKFDCSGMKMQVNYGPVTTEYGVTQDPATWEITSHTVSVEVGAKKEFNVGKVVKGEIGASTGATITIDNTGNVTGTTVKGSVGAGISGPVGSAGVELGGAEVSLSGGFNSSGPSVNSPGSSFLRGN